MPEDGCGRGLMVFTIPKEKLPEISLVGRGSKGYLFCREFSLAAKSARFSKVGIL
jgi:hypothetical protein